MNGKKRIRILSIIVLIGCMGIFPTDVEGTEVEDPTDIGNVAVTELDLGDYAEQMKVGEKQLLSVTCLPLEASETTITYTSSDTAVATINGMGRITAVSVGTTTIRAAVGEVNASFVLQVVEAGTDVVPVNDIEIADHEDELYVEKTLSLSATVLPSNATDSDITYSSSDVSVATVSSTGEVKGIAEGNVNIYVSAGNVTKTIPLTVKVATTGIQLNRNYLVLKPNETYQLSATVIPAETAQTVTYRVEDTAVASVSSGGLVTAKKNGSTTVIVSNGDFSAAVSVIVNQSVRTASNEAEDNSIGEVGQKVYAEMVQASEQKMVDSAMLRYLYENHQILQIVGDGYKMILDGRDIINSKNELYTDIALSKDEEGIHFTLNQERELCGAVQLNLEEPTGKYLYLYNNSKEIYEMIQEGNLKELKLTTGGVYLITDKKMRRDMLLVKYFLIAGTVLILFGGGIYVGVKKKYWFW